MQILSAYNQHFHMPNLQISNVSFLEMCPTLISSICPLANCFVLGCSHVGSVIRRNARRPSGAGGNVSSTRARAPNQQITFHYVLSRGESLLNRRSVCAVF